MSTVADRILPIGANWPMPERKRHQRSLAFGVQRTAMHLADSPLLMGPLLRRLAALEASPDYPEKISDQTKQQTINFVRSTTPPALPPTVLPDEDGAVLQWVAGGDTVIVHIEDAGPVLLWAKVGASAPVTQTEPLEIAGAAQLILGGLARRIMDDFADLGDKWTNGR